MLLVDDQGLITHLTILVLGSQHTGKSELVKAFIEGNPSVPSSAENCARSKSGEDPVYFSRYFPTIERSATVPILPNSYLRHSRKNSSKIENISRAITLNIIEVGGYEGYSAVVPSSVAAADAFMLVYDAGSRASFEDLWPYFRLINEVKGKNQPTVIVGSMVDTLARSVRQRQVPAEAREELGALLQCATFETCARAKLAVHNIFHSLTEAAQNSVFENGVVEVLKRQQRLLKGVQGWDRFRTAGSAKSTTSERQSNRYSTISLAIPPSSSGDFNFGGTGGTNYRSSMSTFSSLNHSGQCTNSNAAGMIHGCVSGGSTIVSSVATAGPTPSHSVPASGASTPVNGSSAAPFSSYRPSSKASDGSSHEQSVSNRASSCGQLPPTAHQMFSSPTLSRRDELFEAWIQHKKFEKSPKNASFKPKSGDLALRPPHSPSQSTAERRAVVAELVLKPPVSAQVLKKQSGPSWTQVESSLAANLSYIDGISSNEKRKDGQEGASGNSIATSSLDALLRDIEDFQQYHAKSLKKL